MATRPKIKMPPAERAKQFASFKALGGLEQALERKRAEMGFREKKVLSEERIAEINDVLLSLKKGDCAEITYHDGERGVTLTLTVTDIDAVNGVLVAGEMKIPFAGIEDISAIV